MLSRLLTFLFCFSFSIQIFPQGEFIVEINEITGSYTKITDVLPNVQYVYPDDVTINENTGTYMFASSQSENRLISLNTTNGNIINNPLTPVTYQGFRYDNTTNTLYALQRDPGNSQIKFGTINPITGAFTVIGSPLNISSVYSGVLSAYDSAQNNYSFMSPPGYTLNNIDASDGSIISTLNLSVLSGTAIGNLVYHPVTGVLYGLLADYNVNLFFLVTIDTTTGVITKIGSGSIYGSSAASGTIDIANQRFIYCYSSGTVGGYSVTALDLTNGNLIYNHLLAAFSTMDNFNSVVYDNVQGKLFALHYDSEVLGIDEFTNQSIQLYPNPVQNIFTIATELEASYNISDINGDIIMNGMLVKGKNTLNTNKLKSGFYIISIQSLNGKFNYKIIKK